MQIAYHKRAVLVLSELNLALGYQPELETLFSVVCGQKNGKTPDLQQVLGLRSPSNLDVSHYQYQQKQAGDILGRD